MIDDSTLKSCLTSAQNGIRLENLSREYEMLTGELPNFRSLGFSSLREFLATKPYIKISERGGQTFIEAIPDDKTQHITSLVNRQRPALRRTPNKGIQRNYMPKFNIREPSRNNNRFVQNDVLHSYGNGRITIKNDVPGFERPRVAPIPALMTIPTKPPENFTKVRNNMWSPIGSAHNSPSKLSRVPTSPNSTINTKQPSSVILEKPKLGKINTNGHQHENKLSDRLAEKRNAIPSILTMPTSPVTATPTLKSAATIVPKSPESSCEALKALVAGLNLPPPEYKTNVDKSQKGGETVTYAKVKFGQYSYTSYPAAAGNEEEAQEIAAREALKDLTCKYGPFEKLVETRDKLLIVQRIIAIVTNAYPKGVIMHEVPALYKKQFQEILPKDWFDSVKNCNAIVFEKGADNSTILWKSTSDKQQAESPSPKEKPLQPVEVANPGHVELPKKNPFLVLVTYVLGTTDIWARPIEDDYEDKFVEMVEEMDVFYTQMKQSRRNKPIVIGQYYVIESNNSWHRVYCLDCDSKTGLAKIFFIDVGDTDECNITSLYPLDKKFEILPAQAFRLCLEGLEDFEDCEAVTEILEDRLHGRLLYVDVLSAHKEKSGPVVTAIFYDTGTEDDINLNQEITNFIQMSEEFMTPNLESEGKVAEVYISNVRDTGEVYLQIQSKSMKYLVKLMNRLISTGFTEDDIRRASVDTIDVSKIYLTKSPEDQSWYRAKIVNIYPSNELVLRLIDFGKFVTVTKNDLLSLGTLSPLLNSFPAQALVVKLHNIPETMFGEKMVKRLSELAPPGQLLLTKVIKTVNHVPIVELFKRKPDNELVSINNTLALEPEITKTGDGNNNVRARKRSEKTVSRNSLSHNRGSDVGLSLKPPKIPDIGNYFNVHVTMAANPGNFIVQPHNDMTALEKMMTNLQERFKYCDKEDVTPDAVKPGYLFAGKHTDGYWYRVSISEVLAPRMVTVYYCDFGDVAVLSLDKLQPLPPDFFELPYQAIRAKLVGIVPINKDWSVQDCIRFQELIVEKNFCSIISEIVPDELSPGDVLLGLKLINVDTEEDIHIDKILVGEGRATWETS